MPVGTSSQLALPVEARWAAAISVSIGVTCACAFVLWRLERAAVSHPSPTALVVGALVVFANVYLIWVIMRDCATRFSLDGIARPTVAGRRTYRWSDIVEIRGRGNLVDFKFASGAFRVNLFLFRNSAAIVAFVRTQVPPNVITAEY